MTEKRKTESEGERPPVAVVYVGRTANGNPLEVRKWTHDQEDKEEKARRE